MRVVFISGSIGIGHAARDLVVARELRQLDPSVEIDWLAGGPARDVIAQNRLRAWISSSWHSGREETRLQTLGSGGMVRPRSRG